MAKIITPTFAHRMGNEFRSKSASKSYEIAPTACCNPIKSKGLSLIFTQITPPPPHPFSCTPLKTK